MKKHTNCKNINQVVFNSHIMFSSKPDPLGHLKARWSILTRKMDSELENLLAVIYTCFVLHNSQKTFAFFFHKIYLRKGKTLLCLHFVDETS